MSGASVGQSQPRPRSGRKTLRRCKNNWATDNVVLIDVDTDDFDDVILIDVPESLSKKLRSSSSRKDKRYPWRTVICIDDDEGIENDGPHIEVKENGSFGNGASSSMRSYPADYNGGSSAAVADECQFVQENISPVKISKCKRTYSGKAPAGSRYGLRPGSDTDSSDDDFPDCELVEDSLGKFQKQWEEASLKRKCENRSDQSGIGGCNNSSRVYPDAQRNVGADNMPEQHKEVPVCPSSGKASCEREDSSTATGNLPRDSASCYSKKVSFADYVLKTVLGKRFPYAKADVDYRSDPSAEESAMNYDDNQDHQNFEHRGPRSQNSGQGPQGSSFNPQHEQAAEQVDHLKKASQGSEITPPAEPCLSNYDSCQKVFHNGKASSTEEPRPGTSRFEEADKLLYAEPSSKNINLSDEQMNHDVAPSSDKVGPGSGENFSCGSPFLNSGRNMGNNHHSENGESIYEKFTSRSSHINEAQPGHEKSYLLETPEDLVGSVSNGRHENQEDVHAQDGDIMHGTESCFINDRERLKQTDEYKRAIEEEWASRRRALQIQAEEAQQLRQLQKRRKVEHLRILDMERRQKQRLEEMRESQKKDEEQKNMKELIRVEVRKELSKLEIACHDMASLLRSLGIQVAGELKPSPLEVRVACKRALFAFHPDRSSKSDMRQQVEAEEKFKLISRMKDKFLLT